MIQCRKDYIEYLTEDKKALGIKAKGLKLVFLKIVKPTFRFEVALRKAEYFNNCFGNFFILLKKYYLYKMKRIGWKYGYSIPINTFGKGLSIAHVGTIIVNGNAKVGDYCRIHCCVNIGNSAGGGKSPVIGNRVYIGPGAKIFGGIILADSIAVGANSVVNKSFEEPNISIAGVPAKKISNKGSRGMMVFDDE